MADKKRVTSTSWLMLSPNPPSKGIQLLFAFLDDDNQRDDAWLQSLAAEFNISDDRDFPRFRLRWFTPAAEVDLCGHATLASAHILFSNGLVDSEIVEFDTRSRSRSGGF